jgi:hypothetical protein
MDKITQILKNVGRCKYLKRVFISRTQLR